MLLLTLNCIRYFLTLWMTSSATEMLLEVRFFHRLPPPPLASHISDVNFLSIICSEICSSHIITSLSQGTFLEMIHLLPAAPVTALDSKLCYTFIFITLI